MKAVYSGVLQALSWVAAVSLVGCGEASPPALPLLAVQQVLTAESVPSELSLHVDGWVDNRAPVAIGPRMNWMPFLRSVPDGARVLIGEELVLHDTVMLRQWITDQQQVLVELTARQESAALELARKLEELQRTEEDSVADQAVRRAKLAADRSDEVVQRRLAELELAQAQRALVRTTKHAADAQALADAGRTPRTDAATALAARARAQRQVTATEETLAAWSGDGAKALSRQRLEIAVERSRRELAGLASASERLANARAAGEAGLRLARGELEWVTLELSNRRKFAADPTLLSSASGTVRLKDPGVRRGAKLPATPCLFILEDRETVAYVRIPEVLRDLCTIASSARPDDGQALVTIPAAQLVTSARVISIGATAEARPDGSRMFIAVLRLTATPEQLTQLKPGMHVRAELVAAAQPLAALPAWAVHVIEDPREPYIQPVTPGSEPRRIRGVRVAGRFIATQGLAAGEQIVALSDASHARRGTAGEPLQTRRRRLSGVLEPVDAVPVRLSTHGWDITEVVPDGAQVQRGQVVARLSKSAWWIDIEKTRWNRERGARIADIEAIKSRLEADRQLLEKAKAWREADLNRAEARISWLSDGTEDRAREWEKAEAARVEAEAAAGQATAQAELTEDPRARPAMSGNEVADAQLGQQRTRHAADSATLTAAAVRWPDFLTGLGKLNSFTEALDKAEAASAEWHLANLQHGQQWERAERGRRRKVDELVREGRELDDEVVYSPVAGRLFHRNTWPWRPGDGLWINEPFRVVPDPLPGTLAHRRLRLEVPAHRAGEWAHNSLIRVTVPGVDTFTGTVALVATWYGTSSIGRQESEVGGGSTAIDEQVFNLVIDLPLSVDEAQRVLPGMTAYVE